MPASLTSISKKRVPLKFSLEPYGGEGDIQLVYRPNAISAEDVQKLADDERGTIAMKTVDLFISKIESWDATGEDGKVIPLTREALQKIEPWQLLDDILTACNEDQKPDPKTGNA